MKNCFIVIVLMLILVRCSNEKSVPVEISLKDEWKFKTGDNIEWARPDFDDSDWKMLSPRDKWERFGVEDYDGYAWYRKSFYLPQQMRQQAFIQDSLQIVIGTVDDTEQTFLNGHLLGQNGMLVPVDTVVPGEFEGDPEAYQLHRRYVLPVDDPRINWDGENVVAVRVHDHGGGGGIYYEPGPSVSMVDVKDYLLVDATSKGYQLVDKDKFKKDILVRNISGNQTFDGALKLVVSDFETGNQLYSDVKTISIKPGEKQIYSYLIEVDQSKPNTAVFSFQQKEAQFPVEVVSAVPYILTPAESLAPSINGPKITGARPGNPVLFKVPCSGEKPVQYNAENLPEGLEIDQETGIIAGKVAQEGTYEVQLTCVNAHGQDSRMLTIQIGNEISLTPPMGWNSWNCWGLSVDEEKVKSAADYMESTGLIDYGWTYINIDDGWEAAKRTKDGLLLGNEKFPDFKKLADYVHGKGLKLGIYSSPGPLTCGGYLGSYQHEAIDAKTWAEWGIDYLKYDWCSYNQIASDHSLGELQKPYILMGDILKDLDRDIVYSLCQYGWGDVYKWGNDVGGDLWRTTGDIVDTWQSVRFIGFEQQDSLYPYAGPGGWNDPDMLVVGWVGWGPNLHETKLTTMEQYSHISLWALLASPLLLGNDLSRMDDFTLSLLKNKEVIEINQDEAGNQAEKIYDKDNIQVWKKTLADGSVAVGVFNLNDEIAEGTIISSELNLETGLKIRDLWRQQDKGELQSEMSYKLLPHDVLLVKLSN